jgi:hypothetical protein
MKDNYEGRSESNARRRWRWLSSVSLDHEHSAR